jgi:hypothetical protein
MKFNTKQKSNQLKNDKEDETKQSNMPRRRGWGVEEFE